MFWVISVNAITVMSFLGFLWCDPVLQDFVFYRLIILQWKIVLSHILQAHYIKRVPPYFFELMFSQAFPQVLHYIDVFFQGLNGSPSPQMTSTTSIKKCSVTLNGSYSFGDCNKTKPLQRTQRHSVFKRFGRSKNMVGISSGDNSGKLYNFLPIAR